MVQHATAIPRKRPTTTLRIWNVIWQPRFRRVRVEIEKIQRWATKLIPELQNLSYSQLRALRLQSLQHYRRRGDMMQIYKIVNGIDRVDRKIFFKPSSGSTTRGHSKKLLKNRLDLELGSL